MKYFKRCFWIFALMTLLLSIYTVGFHSNYGGPYATAQNDSSNFVSEGKRLFQSKNCQACHGPDGHDPITETYPIVGGQNLPYLQQQIQDIMKGYRTNGMASQMKAVVGSLTDEEIKYISIYLSSMK